MRDRACTALGYSLRKFHGIGTLELPMAAYLLRVDRGDLLRCKGDDLGKRRVSTGEKRFDHRELLDREVGGGVADVLKSLAELTEEALDFVDFGNRRGSRGRSASR